MELKTSIVAGVMLEKSFERCGCPSSSPWGHVQSKKEQAPGIWSVSTSGHGGYYLSRQRINAMPAGLRDITPWLGFGSWFEEDCDWAIVCAAFPLAFNDWKGAAKHALDTLRGYSRAQAGLSVFLATDLGRAFKLAADTFEAATLDLWFRGSFGSGRNGGWSVSAHNGRGTLLARWEQPEYPEWSGPFEIDDVVKAGHKVSFEDIKPAPAATIDERFQS